MIRILALAIALLLMAALIARLGPHTIAAELANVGPGALWLLVAYAAGTTIGALPWYVLLPGDARPSPGAAILSRFAASGVNAVLVGIGGEPARLLWLRASDRATGIAAIVLDRLTYAAASALFLFMGAIAAVRLTVLPRDYAIAATAGGIVALALVAIAVWLVARQRIASRIGGVIARMRRRAVPSGGLANDVDRELSRLLDNRRAVLLAIGIGVVARLVLGLEVYAGFRVIGIDISLDAAFVFAAVPVFLAFIGTFVPSQIGIQESSQALVAAALGISPPAAVAVVLLQRIRQLVTSSFALLVIVTARRSATASAAAR